MPVPPRPKLRRFGFAVLIAVVIATTLRAGPLPNLLDDNRGNVGLGAIESAAFVKKNGGSLLASPPISFACSA